MKLSYFLSTAKAGSHNFVFGFDNFKEWRKNNNWQSGSAYGIQATRAIYDGANIYPVFLGDNTTYINWMPLVKETVGNDIKTYSGYINDAWRFNNKLSVNIGARYDANRSTDQSGTSVVKDSQWSPRVGVTYDIKGDSSWVANASFSRYVMGISTALVDAGSAGGRTASYSWYYKGPNVNAGSGPYLTAEQALPILWAWFDKAGGNNMTTRQAPSIPGVSTRVGSGVKSPSTNELAFGVSHQLGQKGIVRVDYVHRKSVDMYGDFLNTSTDYVLDPTGRKYNLTVVGNTEQARRTYNGFIANLSYRFKWVALGANYTLGKMWGNANGENSGSGPIRSSMDTYPEYRQESWNYPMGYNPGDQRHKFRGMATFHLPFSPSLGSFDLGMVQRFDSGIAQDISGSVDARPYVTNPGSYYLAPPSSFGYYFFPRGSYRFDSIWTSDMSLSWGKRLPGMHTEVFFRGVVSNMFNNAGQTGGDLTLLTNVTTKTYATFNPFTTTPVEGTNWAKGAKYGLPQAVTDYQPARLFNFSVGVRF